MLSVEIFAEPTSDQRLFEVVEITANVDAGMDVKHRWEIWKGRGGKAHTIKTTNTEDLWTNQ
jgi:hypothetical protein